VTVPIAAVGCEWAHALANIVFGAPDRGRAELFDGGPGAGALPILVSLALAAILVGLVGRATGAWSTSQAAAARLPFALLPPMLFIVQEHVETVLNTGAVPFGTAIEPSFLPGLLLQIPFAIAGYAIAWALVRLADGVRARVAARRRAAHLSCTFARRWPAERAVAPSEAHRWAHSGRAPPAASAATA
jgi:hypothetical protein